jgi:hypothetical protein
LSGQWNYTDGVNKVCVGTRVEPELARAVRRLADQGNRTVSREVAEAIRRHVMLELEHTRRRNQGRELNRRTPMRKPRQLVDTVLRRNGSKQLIRVSTSSTATPSTRFPLTAVQAPPAKTVRHSPTERKLVDTPRRSDPGGTGSIVNGFATSRQRCRSLVGEAVPTPSSTLA